MIRGETLRMLREVRQWDQQTLAHHTGIDPSVISRLERGLQNDLKASVLVKLAQTLEVSIDDLVGITSHQTYEIIGELIALLPLLQQLSPAHQRQVAAILRGYLTTLPVPSDESPSSD